MTANQIAYWNLQETKRANQARESETNRSNVAQETETNRHNVATEKETGRHNKATESIDIGKLNETSRHNQALESLEQGKLNLGWSNLAETQRHNVAQENIGGMNISLGYSQLAETQRHNTEQERISSYSAQADATYKDTMASINSLASANRNQLSQAQQREIDARIQNMKDQLDLARRSHNLATWRTASEIITNNANVINNLLRTVTGGLF